MTARNDNAQWWSRAACSTADPDLFFPISTSGPALRQVAQAKAICARCQIQRECLDFALDAGPVQGVWGGMTEEERRLARRRERRADTRHTWERAAASPVFQAMPQRPGSRQAARGWGTTYAGGLDGPPG